MNEEELRKENDELREKLRILQGENEILTEGNESILLLASTAKKMAVAETKSEAVKVALEDITLLKEIQYCSFIEAKEKQIRILDDFGLNYSESWKGKEFPFTDDLISIFGEKKQVMNISEGKPLLGIMPTLTNCPPPKSFYTLPLNVQNAPAGWLLFVNCQPDNAYFEKLGPSLDRVGEILQTRIESIDLVDHLRKSELNYRTIFDSGSDAIIIHDPKTGEILDVNSKMTEMFGYTREEARRITVGAISSGLHPFTDDEAVRLVRKTYEENRPQIFEWQCKNKEGHRFWAELTLKHILINGESRILAVSHDITERKEAEKALKESEEKYRSLMNEMPLGTAYHRIVLDEEGHPVDYVFLEVNAMFATLTGLEQKEIIGKCVTEVLPGIEHDPADWIGKYGKVALTGEEVHFDQHSEQLSRWFHVHAYSPRKNYFAVIFEDVTKLRQANEALILAKEQAEEATKLKDRFVSLVAHDLKSPFTSILGFLRLVISDKKNPLYERHGEIIGKVIKTSESMHKMIDELLDISRLQTGKIKPRPRFIDVRTITGAVVANNEFLAEKKGIEIVNEIPDGTRIYADINLFSEVIHNLISNAIKFCEKGNQIRLFIPPKQKTVIAVQNNGMCINRKILPDIFRHDIKTSTKGSDGEIGTGLGLPYSFDIMKAHGGSLKVESVENSGTVFYAELPYLKPQVLVVDDEDSVRVLISEFLRSLDVNIIEADSGIRALELLEQITPHLMIVDIMMPGMNGFELLEMVKSDSKLKDIPFLFVTSDKEMESRDKAFRLGASDFLNKPLEMEEFIPRIKRLI